MGSTIRQLLCIFTILTLFSSFLFARGTDESAWDEVEGTENWRHEIDISDTQPGSYNLIIRGSDFAGNEFIEGPFDIRIDPESDLPHANTIYPANGSVVRGNININGAASDDDSIDHVEIQIDDGPFQEAEGSEYWLYYIGSDEIEDGEHTITVKAFDENSLEGPVSTSTFILDTRPPEVTITSHSSGAIINGNLRFEGQVTDENGIDSVLLSTDGTESFEEINFRRAGEDGVFHFNFPVRTNNMEDGPYIYWIRGIDSTGSQADTPFLFFVENQSPEIQIISPEAESQAHGITEITGRVYDAVGMERFWYTWQNEEYDIELTPGNPYWSTEIDLRDVDSRWAELEFFAEDTNGNQSSIQYRLENDIEGAKPVVNITYPTTEEFEEELSFPPNSAIYGHVSGVHRGQAIIVSGLEEEDVEFSATPGFRIPLNSLPPGEADLRIRARDNLGIIGNERQLRFTVTAEAPEIRIDSIVYKNETEETFRPGMEYDRLQEAVLIGSVQTQADLESVTVRFTDEESEELSPRVQTTNSETPGETVIQFPVPRTHDEQGIFGMVNFTVTVEDEFGTVSEHQSQLFFRDTRRIEAGPEIVLTDSRIQPDNRVLFTGDTPLLGRVIGLTGGSTGEAIRNIRLDPTPGIVRLRSSRNTFEIHAVREGTTEDIYIHAETEDGIEIQDGPYVFVIDTTRPDVSISSPSDPDINGTSFFLQGQITDDSEITLCEYSLDGGQSFTEVELRTVNNGYSFSQLVDLGEDPEAGYGLILRAYDAHGNVGVDRFILNTLEDEPIPSEPEEERNNDSPDIDFYIPGGNTAVTHSPQVGGIIHDLDGIRFIEMSVNGDENFRRAASFDLRRHHQTFLIDLPNLQPGEHEITLRATDRLGEESREYSTDITIVSENMEIEFTGIGEEEDISQGFTVPIGETLEITGIIANAERLDSAVYSIDETQEERLRTRSIEEAPLTRGFSITIPDNLSYGSHTLTVAAENTEGKTAEAQITFFVRSAENPPEYTNQVIFNDNRLENRNIRFSELEGLTGRFEGREVRSVSLIGPEVQEEEEQTESPTEYLRIRSRGSLITLTPLQEGRVENVRIRVTTIDGLEYTSRAYSVFTDTEDPQVTLTSPDQGKYFNETVPLQASISDSVNIEEIEYRIGGEGIWVPLTTEGTIVNTDIPLEGQPSGPLHLYVRAIDDFGNSATEWLTVNYDPAQPEFTFITPPQQDVVNGLTSVIASINSISPITELSYSLDGETFQPLNADDFFSLDVDFTIQELGGPGAREEEEEAAEDSTSEDEVSEDGSDEDDTENQDAEDVDSEEQPEDIEEPEESTEGPAPQPVIFRAQDAAGNITEISPDPQLDLESDLPEIEIQIPEDNAVITNDFSISGMAFDDDGIQNIYWRFDDQEFRRLPGGNNFSIDVSLEELTDNEHTIEIYAVDEFGLEGETVSQQIQVSLREPILGFTNPDVESTNRGTIILEGTARDANGVESVFVSLDNGNTYQEAEGTDSWSYELDSRVYTDGTYSVQVLSTDELGIEGQLFTLLNIDNTHPELQISQPVEGSGITESLQVNGLVEDNDQIVRLELEILPLSREGEVITHELSTERVIQETVDISTLEQGQYSIRVTAYDAADNTAQVSKNISIHDELESSFVTLLFPREGEEIHGSVIVEGRVRSNSNVNAVQIYANDSFLDSAELNRRGYYKYEVAAEDLTEGENTLQAFIEPASGERIESDVRSFQFTALGPYVQMQSHQIGDFISNRPWLEGTAGYNHNYNEEDNEQRDLIRGTQVRETWVSIDNGRTFERANGREQWRYRLETQDIPEGPLSVLVRSVFRNGEEAITRSLFTVDKEAPQITLLSPQEDSLLNESIRMIGTASDEHSIQTIEAALRPGGKAGYEVPEFIQGMYLDSHGLGLTFFDVGLGLTFFDDNVKLQAQFGVGPENDRFSGFYIGGKLLANIANIPFSSFLGPDWNWLSMSFAVGANFSYIWLYEPIQVAGGEPVNGVVLSCILGQLEFPRITIPDLGAFHTYSLYTEPQIWFIPSDVSPAIIPKLSIGLRIGLF
ncbi:MAG: Ig-like domain-containing protein [Spirochaetia bacterium]